jgi:aryl-alcohol dehydrogenase-like predicted oxidoreductase
VGINFFDCANVYAKGRSEEILGKLITGERDDVVITSKAYFPTGTDVNARGATRRHLMRSVEDSLRRLNVETIDVYFMHRFDDTTPLEETLRALDDLVEQGKILYPGASNYAAWQVAKALGISARHSWARFEVLEPMYNLVKRQAEVEILPLARSEHIGVIPYSPLGGGLLTGKYGIDRRPESGRLVSNTMYAQRYGDASVYQIAEAFTTFAHDNGYNPVSLAVAWVGGHPAVTAPIIGARNVPQLEGSLGALSIDMTADLHAAISALSIEPPPAIDRTEERSGDMFSAQLTQK